MDGIGRGLWPALASPLGQRQSSGIAGQRLAHQGLTRQDESPAKIPFCIKDINSSGGARHDHQQIARLQTAGAEQGAPAIHAQLPWVLIAVTHPCRLRRATHTVPLRSETVQNRT